MGLAIAISAASFVLLAGTGQTTDIRVEGTIAGNYRAAYDILVRPKRSQGALERSKGLVANGALGGLFGGITLGQYRRIRVLPGVEVAAPVANIGYVIPYAVPEVSLRRFLDASPTQLYRVRFESVADGGTSRYPGPTDYVYINRSGQAVSGTRGNGSGSKAGKHQLAVCGTRTGADAGPFSQGGWVDCFSGNAEEPVVGIQEWFPVLFAAIDPEEESRLVHLDRSVVAGRYLREADAPHLNLVDPATRAFHRDVPVIASTRTFVDQTLFASVERLDAPTSESFADLLSGANAAELDRLSGTVVGSRSVSAQASWDQALAGVFGGAGPENISWSYWSGSPVRYALRGDSLAPEPVANPLGVWKDAGPPANGSYVQAPSADADLQFQRLRPRVGSGTFEPGTGGQILDTPVMDIVGRYDPSKLPGFSPLSKVPLGTYYPPEITPANAPSRRALGGKSLLPSANIGGYVSQPPLFLTTLKGMEAFLDPKYYEGANASAPISMIRVRVRGVNGPDTLSQARVRAVATAIHDATALQVDITAGSSPVQVRVALPAGRFGRPALLLSERWSKKGVSLQFLQALDHKRFGLLLLILASCAVFVGGVAYASVLGRRSELGILRCLGWPKRAVFTSVLAELAVVGLVAGALAALVSLAAVPRLAPGGSRWTAALAVPVSVLMALLAGLIPARNAARVAPIAVVSDPIVAPRKRRPNGGIFSMAVANARRAPVRNLAAGSGLLVASAALTVLVGIDAAFRGSVVGTLLGAAVSVKVRGLDFLAVAVVAILGAVSLLNAVLQSFRERRQETATLKAIGWGEAHILRLAAAEASLVAAICATAGGVVGGVIAMSLGVPIAALLFVIGAGVVGSIFVAVAATKVAIGIESRSGSPAISAE